MAAKENVIRSMVPLYSRKKSYLINLASCILLIALVYTTLGASFSRDIYINLIGISFSQMKGLAFVICYTTILAVSLNISTGCLGEMVLGHAGFMAIGAYAGSIFLKYITNNVIDLNTATTLVSSLFTVLAMLIAFIAAAISGLIVGIPALRLRGDYLAIITLGFGQIIVKLLELFDFTGGASGLKNVPKNENIVLYLVVVVVVVALIFLVMRSRFGRAILAIREDRIAAEATGVPVTKYKITAFSLSAGLAGIAGVMYAQYLGTLLPTAFEFNYSVELLMIVVLGGLGSFTGSIFAAIVLTLLPEILRFMQDYRLIIYSISLVIIMIKKPGGLLGRYEFSMTKFLKLLPSRIKALPKNTVKFLKSIPDGFVKFFKGLVNSVKKIFSHKGEAND